MNSEAEGIRIALTGDVMLGRGIDQILPHPSDPKLYEPHVGSALEYLALTERASGPIPRPVDFGYVWGDAPAALERAGADLRIVNLETAVTRADRPLPKGINYRMNPANLPCLAAFGVDCCLLANNHVLDWGTAGLLETLDSLAAAGLTVAGAGRDAEQAAAPAVLPVPGKGRVLVFAAALPSSGVPVRWAATAERPGVALLDDLSPGRIAELAERIAGVRQAGDLVVVSLHWGPNWGYAVPRAERDFARALIESAGVDLVHGHSSHHAKALELHRGRPILYGCGDFLNDYEGIGGEEDYRGDLVLLYLASFAGVGRRCRSLEMLPFRIRKFRLQDTTPEETAWLQRRLDRECHRFGGRVEQRDGRLILLSQGD